MRQDPEVYSAFRRAGMFCLVGLLLLFYTRLHETLTARYGTTGGLLYVFTIPSLVAMILSGGLRRAFAGRAVVYWCAFVLWMVVSIPFSVWRGGATTTVYGFVRTQLPVMILLAGLLMTWKDCRLVLCAIGVAGIFNVLSSRFLGHAYGDRLGLESATIGNPNDYAGQLLMVLPFVVYMVLHPPRLMFPRILLRVTGAAVVFYGIYLILASGSRGAMLGLGATAGFVLLKATGRTRLAVVTLLAVSLGLIAALLPGDVLSRLSSFSSKFDSGSEAAQSASLRKQLAVESLVATIQHPLFGVGPGQFANFEGQKEGTAFTANGERVAAWINAHNSYSQISADNGIPGFLFYMAGVISPFLMLLRTWKPLRGKPEYREKADACFCLLIAWVGFCVAIFFLNFAYFFYLPAYAGLAIALSTINGRELVAAEAVQGSIRPSMVAPSPTMAVAPVAPPTVPSNRFRFNRYR